MKVSVQKLPKATIKLEICISNEKVKDAYNKAVDNLIKEAEIPGFRKGRAPKEKIVEKTDKSELYGETVNLLLQTYYPQALKEHRITPITNPKVELKEFDLEKDFEFTAIVAIKPEVAIGNYMEKIKETYEKKLENNKKIKEEKFKAGEKIEESPAHLSVDDVVNSILNVVEVEIADILIEEETNRMLTRLVQQIQAVGLSTEDYMKAQNKTSEQLRKEYEDVARKTLTSEFALSQLVRDRKIEINDEEVEETIKNIGPEQERERLKNTFEKWYIKNVLAKNKLISQLAEETEGLKNEN